MTTYVQIWQWHVVALVYRGGAVKTRCGRGPFRVVGTLDRDDDILRDTTTDLPVNEATCNRCLALVANDAEAQPDFPGDEEPHAD